MLWLINKKTKFSNAHSYLEAASKTKHPCIFINPLNSGNPKMSTFVNSEDLDEMQHNAAFHQGLHCLKSKKRSSDNFF